jgi:hypothetical protein
MGSPDTPGVAFDEGIRRQQDCFHNRFPLQLRPIFQDLVDRQSLGEINQHGAYRHARPLERQLTMTDLGVHDQVLSDRYGFHERPLPGGDQGFATTSIVR